jgi:hypothetical protein
MGTGKFRSESEMIAWVARHVSTVCSANGDSWVLLPQYQADTRIPDLVAARLDPHALKERMSMGLIRALTRSEIAVVRRLRLDRATGARTVALHVAMAPQSVLRILRSLEGDGYVTRAQSGGYVRTYPLRRLVTKYVSVEAKLSDWRAALAQAAAHGTFADERYVAFDAAYSRRFLKAKEMFATMGVGLIAVDAGTGTCAELLCPNQTRTDFVSRAHADERVLSALLNEQTRPLPETRLPGAVAPSASTMAPSLLGAACETVALLLPVPR